MPLDLGVATIFVNINFQWNVKITCYYRETGVGTVGAVAVDAEGHVAVATSTGGISGKMVGRVGDTPLPGKYIPFYVNFQLFMYT